MNEYLIVKAEDDRLVWDGYDIYVLLRSVPESLFIESNERGKTRREKILVTASSLAYIKEMQEDFREHGQHASRVKRVRSRIIAGCLNVSPHSDGTIIKANNDDEALDKFFNLEWEVPEDEVHQ